MLQLIQDALSQYGYLAAFGLVFLGASCVPLPVSLIMVFSGVLLGRGYFALELMLPVLVAATVLGDLFGYLVARRLTPRPRGERYAGSYASLQVLETHLKARPMLTVAGSRFVPFVNAGVNGLAGMCRLTPGRFLLASIAGNVAFAWAYLAIGQAFGRTWGDATAAATWAGVAALTVGLSFLAGLLFRGRAEA